MLSELENMIEGLKKENDRLRGLYYQETQQRIITLIKYYRLLYPDIQIEYTTGSYYDVTININKETKNKIITFKPPFNINPDLELDLSLKSF